MKTNARSNRRFIAITAALLSVAIISAATATTPQYQIYDIGVIDAGDDASQGFGVSHGGIAVGRSIRTGGSQAFTWTLNGGIVGLPNLAGRNHAVSNSANDNGVVVGTAATTLFGTSRLPVMWQNGAVSQLPLPPGETLGDANSVNASSVAVGSVDAGSLQRGAIYSGGSGDNHHANHTERKFFRHGIRHQRFRPRSWARGSIRTMPRATLGSSMTSVRTWRSRSVRCRGSMARSRSA